MLLIYSDMFKSFWLLLFPAVELIDGKIETGEIFCQVSGFFLALSIEASDVAVALISVHTALFIFRGEQGLYPFRKAAYAVAAILPIVMASFAFIESPGYVNTGQFCYLPFNPMWKRLALSWIPRYVAFAIILCLCIGVYVYVRVLMSRFGSGNESSKNTLSKLSGFESLEPLQQPIATVPPTPTIKYHGLLPTLLGGTLLLFSRIVPPGPLLRHSIPSIWRCLEQQIPAGFIQREWGVEGRPRCGWQTLALI
jgi:G protein-coupled receptor GPR1